VTLTMLAFRMPADCLPRGGSSRRNADDVLVTDTIAPATRAGA
jgi:hypothetical protein